MCISIERQFALSYMINFQLISGNFTISIHVTIHQFIKINICADTRVRYIGCYHHGSTTRAMDWEVLEPSDGNLVNLENCVHRCAVLHFRYVGLTVSTLTLAQLQT